VTKCEDSSGYAARLLWSAHWESWRITTPAKIRIALKALARGNCRARIFFRLPPQDSLSEYSSVSRAANRLLLRGADMGA